MKKEIKRYSGDQRQPLRVAPRMQNKSRSAEIRHQKKGKGR